MTAMTKLALERRRCKADFHVQQRCNQGIYEALLVLRHICCEHPPPWDLELLRPHPGRLRRARGDRIRIGRPGTTSAASSASPRSTKTCPPGPLLPGRFGRLPRGVARPQPRDERGRRRDPQPIFDYAATGGMRSRRRGRRPPRLFVHPLAQPPVCRHSCPITWSSRRRSSYSAKSRPRRVAPRPAEEDANMNPPTEQRGSPRARPRCLGRGPCPRPGRPRGPRAARTPAAAAASWRERRRLRRLDVLRRRRCEGRRAREEESQELHFCLRRRDGRAPRDDFFVVCARRRRARLAVFLQRCERRSLARCQRC